MAEQVNRVELTVDATLMGWTLRFGPVGASTMRLPFLLGFSDGELIIDAALLGTGIFPVRHAWIDGGGGETEMWLRHLGVPKGVLTHPHDQVFDAALDMPTLVALVAAARARFLGLPAPSSWPHGLPRPEVLGVTSGRQGGQAWQSLEGSAHPATYPVGLRLLSQPTAEFDAERDALHVSLPTDQHEIVLGAALLAGKEVLSSTHLARSASGWEGWLPLYMRDPNELELDIFDPEIGVGMPAEGRPEAWAALRDFARGYWCAELPDREQSRLVIVVRNGLGESSEVRPNVKGSDAPAMRRLALVELRCAWFGEELDPGACAVDRALAFAGLNDTASAVQAVMGAGVAWLLRAAAEAADDTWPQIQGELRRACESLSELVDQPLADDLRASAELLAARPDLDDELRELLQPEPARVLGIPPTAFDKGRQWVQSRESLLTQDWDGDEPDRPLLAEWWAADVRR